MSYAIRLAILLAIIPAAAGAQSRLDHPGLGIPRIKALCSPLEHPGLSSLFKRRDSLASLLGSPEGRRNPDTWRAAGCVNGLLYLDEPMVRNRGVVVRARTASMALTGFSQASTLRPGDSIAALGMAALALDFAESDDATAIIGRISSLAAAAYGAVRAGVTAPIVLRMCTEFQIADGDFATARYCSHRALERGVDSTWHLERRALLAFLEDSPDIGATWFEIALAAAHDSAARDDIAWRVRWIADTNWARPGAIPSAWRTLSDSARIMWVREHLANGAPAGDDIGRYISVLQHAFSTPMVQGPVFERCPIMITNNGAEQAADRKGCLSDSYSPGKRIGLTGVLLRLWDPETGNPLGLLGYTLDRRVIRSDEGDFDHRIANAAITLRQYEWETTSWRDTTIGVKVAIPNTLSGAPLPGVAVFPVFPGTVTWSIAAKQGMNYGALSTDGMQALDVGPLTLSDLVLGVEEQGVSFPLRDDTIVLAPQNVVKKQRPLELYFQLRSDVAMDSLRANIVLRRIVQGKIETTPELTMVDRLIVRPGITPVHRQLNIAHIGGNDHQLEVQIVNKAGQIVARRAVNLLVR